MLEKTLYYKKSVAKKNGIMQPYFFLYFGNIILIKRTGEFILFDIVQFIRRGGIERNRVLKQNDIIPLWYFRPLINTKEYVKELAMCVSESVSKRILCLPLYLGLRGGPLKQITDIINLSC